MRPQLFKPRRGFSRLHTTINVALAWGAIGYSMYLGASMASSVVPTMVILIASLLGIYQGVGHFDLRSQLQAGAAPSSRSGDAIEDEPIAERPQ